MPVLVLFTVGLAMRLLFWLATPDGGPGWHVGFQGDAPVWQELAGQLAHGPLEGALGLPLRPPLMQWFVALLWNGDPATVWWPRLVFTLLGAAIAPLLWLLLRSRVDPGVAWLAAGLCAVSSNLLLLGSGLHVEGLYLVLVLVSLFDQERLAGARPHAAAVRWGFLQGGLCLLRAEHVLTVFVFAVLAQRAGATLRTLLLAGLTAAAVIAPWQLHANRTVDAFNAGAPQLPPVALPWEADALAALRGLPAFQQVPVYGFVSDTVRVRGGRQVRAADLGIVHEAYGCSPAPLPHGFVAIYGGLNFFLGNTPEAASGFSSAALDRPPPLAGGDARYPPGLRSVLPRGGTIAFGYPPHLDLVVNGTRRGLQELAADPVAGAARILGKLWHAVEGATGGVGGRALPIGLSGTRRQVDLVTATSPFAQAWRVAVLLAALLGLWSLRAERALWPLLAFAATKLLVVAAVFGYARHGALCVPVTALGVAALVHRFVAAVPSRARVGWILLALLLAVEAHRSATVTATVDDQPATRPLPPRDFQARRLVFD